MRSIDSIRRSAIALAPDRTVTEAARTMETAGVGAIGIVDDDRLVGIVTDRDLVRRAMARGLAPDARVDSVMTTAVTTIDADADVHDAFGLLRQHGVRRLPVVRGDRFVGMLTLDDLLVDLARDLADLARPVRLEMMFSHHDAQLPATV